MVVVEVDVGKVLVVEWEKYEATAVSGLLLLWRIGLGHAPHADKEQRLMDIVIRKTKPRNAN